MVSGAISLMLAVAPSLTRKPGAVRSLSSSAKPFPLGSNCTTATLRRRHRRCGRRRPGGAAHRRPVDRISAACGGAPAGIRIRLGHQFRAPGRVIFATWFTHDLNGKAWNLSMTAFQTGPNTFLRHAHPGLRAAVGSVPFRRAHRCSGRRGDRDVDFRRRQQRHLRLHRQRRLTDQAHHPPGVRDAADLRRGAAQHLTLATNYTDMWWAPAGRNRGGASISRTKATSSSPPGSPLTTPGRRRRCRRSQQGGNQCVFGHADPHVRAAVQCGAVPADRQPGRREGQRRRHVRR